jgi:hypothetical protein
MLAWRPLIVGSLSSTTKSGPRFNRYCGHNAPALDDARRARSLQPRSLRTHCSLHSARPRSTRQERVRPAAALSDTDFSSHSTVTTLTDAQLRQCDNDPDRKMIGKRSKNDRRSRSAVFKKIREAAAQYSLINKIVQRNEANSMREKAPNPSQNRPKMGI